MVSNSVPEEFNKQTSNVSTTKAENNLMLKSEGLLKSLNGGENTSKNQGKNSYIRAKYAGIKRVRG